MCVVQGVLRAMRRYLLRDGGITVIPGVLPAINRERCEALVMAVAKARSNPVILFVRV